MASRTCTVCMEFQSTPSARRATSKASPAAMRMRFQSTPSARRATLQHGYQKRVALISIHALREEGDVDEMFQHVEDKISIHALREEGDPSVPGRRRWYA